MDSGRDLRESPPGPALEPLLSRANWARALTLCLLVATPALLATPSHAADRTGDAKGTRRAGPAASTAAQAAGVYWVQVGAYRDAETAAKVARHLREQKYPVHESTVVVVPPPSRPGGGATAAARPAAEARDRYEVVVTGAPAQDVAAKLTARGLTSRALAEGAVVTPALSLGEAVALSQDIAGDGLAVRVRRTETPGTAAASRRTDAPGETLQRVRVGGFPDRAAAERALNELRARGYQPVLRRGDE
jgi:hypothetical protein